MICAATPLAHAMALVPDLLVADADPEGDRRALSDLAAWCLHLSPLTAPREDPVPTRPEPEMPPVHPDPEIPAPTLPEVPGNMPVL